MHILFSTTGMPCPDKFQPGDVVISLKDVNFTDGTSHHVGQHITVAKDSVSYYNVMHRFYDKA